jgi:hypothetical protein
MNRLLIFVAGGIAGYIASGWVEGFLKKDKQTDTQDASEAHTQGA